MKGGSTPIVHLLCGLNGAGKTTYARQLERRLPAARFTLDEWMLRLYPYRFDDPEYADLAENCKLLIWDTALHVLRLGHPVILDWNQWSRRRRTEWRQRATDAGYDATLHYLDVPVETALARSASRNAAGTAAAHRLTAEGIEHMATIFEPPTADEGIEIVTVRT